MTALRSEIKRGLPIVPQPGLGVFLDRNDLNQLDFLGRFGENDRMADPRRTMSLPRHQITDGLSQLLSSLESAGRIRVKQRLDKHSYTPEQSGNLVVRPGEKATVLDIFNDVNLTALQPLLNFQRAHPNMLESATLFPNLSTRGLKGISLQFDPSQKGWWQILSEYNWPFFRGLITTALTIGAEQFIDQSNEILPKVISFGRANGTLKYIRFYYGGDDSRVFMSVASGPDDDERRAISKELHNTHKPGKALGLMRSIEETCYNRRQSLAASMNDVLGLGSRTEEVINAPFVMLNIENGQAISGGVGPGSNFLPFTLGDGIIIHHDTTNNISPFGIKRPETGASLPPFFSKESVESFIQTLKNPMVLYDLASGYHTTMD